MRTGKVLGFNLWVSVEAVFERTDGDEDYEDVHVWPACVARLASRNEAEEIMRRLDEDELGPDEHYIGLLDDDGYEEVPRDD